MLFLIPSSDVRLKYKVEIDRNGCIVCATCYTIDPSHFESDPYGKSKVVGGVSNGKSTGTFNDSDNENAQTAANSCPVSVITVNAV